MLSSVFIFSDGLQSHPSEELLVRFMALVSQLTQTYLDKAARFQTTGVKGKAEVTAITFGLLKTSGNTSSLGLKSSTLNCVIYDASWRRDGLHKIL